MKTLPKYLALFIIITGISQFSASASSILLDSFTEGGFSLPASGVSNNRSTIQSDWSLSRTVSLFDPGVSSSLLQTSSGSLIFTFNLRGTNTKDSVFSTINYINSDNSAFNLLGLNAAVFQITNLSGEGEVLVYGSSGPRNSTALPLTGTGTIEYPFSLANGYLGGSGNSSLDFRIIPRSMNFSVTMSEITLIPEPSGACLLVLAAASLMNRCSRRPVFLGK